MGDASTLECGALKDFGEMIAGAWRRALKAVRRRGWSAAGMDPEIIADPAVVSLVEATAGVLDSAIGKVPMSETMRRSLERSNFVFSGFKTYHSLNEAFPSMVDANGELKPFDRFLNDVQSIEKRYNSNYLRAEYNFAVASAQSASQWEQIAADGDRFDLQYRTAGDSKVRPTHAALNGVTLPPSSPFWDSFMPPNGWNCRCTAVQVRRGKYPHIDVAEALALGEEATADDKRGMLRFNPGKLGKTFPDYNPYTISRCRDCDVAKGKSTLAKGDAPESDLCVACHAIIEKLSNSNSNRLRYEKLKDDSDYINVKFDGKSGGVKATHVGHIVHSSEKEELFFGKERLSATDLELLCQDVLFKSGRCCILLNEKILDPRGKQLPQLDAEIDGVVADIRAITQCGTNTIRNALQSKKKQLKNYNNKTGSDCNMVVLYFHDSKMFDESQILPQLGKTLQSVMCVFHDGRIRTYKKDQPEG